MSNMRMPGRKRIERERGRKMGRKKKRSYIYD